MEGARLEGLEKGLEKGSLVGKIQLLRQLLGEEIGSDKDLQDCSINSLSSPISLGPARS